MIIYYNWTVRPNLLRFINLSLSQVISGYLYTTPTFLSLENILPEHYTRFYLENCGPLAGQQSKTRLSLLRS